MTEVELLLVRLHDLADNWDRMAGLTNAPHAFNELYRICAAELRAELRVADTIPSPPPAVTTPAPSAE